MAGVQVGGKLRYKHTCSFKDLVSSDGVESILEVEFDKNMVDG